MELTRDTRMHKLNESSPAVQHLYVSEEAGGKYREVFNEHDLLEAKYADYVLTIGDIVLGFYPISEMKDLLVNNAGIAEETAKQMTAELIEFLTPILERGRAPQQTSAETATETETTTPTFIPTSVTYGPLGEERPQQKQHAEPAKQEVAATEPAPEEPVQPLRTMEDDMDKIHGYGAYRKMYPDANGRKSSPAQEEVPEEEGVHQSTSQDEVLNKRPPLAGTPSYDQPPQQ